MNRWISVTTVAVAGLLVASALALAARFDSSASAVDVCIKANGQLRVATGNALECGQNETSEQWVVGGEVTAIEAGDGLVGGGEEDIVRLGIDPAVLRATEGPQIFGAFDDGPGPIPDAGVIGKLPLPAGAYAIFAKLTISHALLSSSPAVVKCVLQAGDDSDEALAGFLRPIELFSLSQGLEVTHRFAEPGDAVLSCSDGAFGTAEANFGNLKIIAIRGSSLSNVFAGVPASGG